MSTNIESVSCRTAFCAAVGDSGNTAVYRTGTWNAAVHLTSGSLGSVSCASASFCVALSLNGAKSVTWNGTAWSTPVPLTGFAGLPGTPYAAVSCATSSLCVAVDNAGQAIQRSGTTWGAVRTIDPLGYVAAVSCPTTTFCVALDYGGAAIVGT
jgi:hypothetical protein